MTRRERTIVRPAKGLGKIVWKRDARGREWLLLPEGVERDIGERYLEGACAPYPAAGTRGEAEMEEMLARLADAWQDRLGVRAQVRLGALKGRWGVCRPAERLIVLNGACAGLPEEAVEELLLHELCHLRCPDHSPAFWREMARWMPDWARREGALREMKR